jgi:lipopolysaccharide assembly outer membrane protein LptD (OstA)
MPFLGAFLMTLCLSALLPSVVRAQQEADLRNQISIERGEETITVIQNDPGVDGARFILNVRDCEEETRLNVITAPDPGYVETLMNEARIVSPIALLRRPEEGEEEETLDLFGGSITFDAENPRNRCPQDVARSDGADVVITEGRTTISGTSLFYENATGIGRLAGPVQLKREPEGDAELLEATAETLELNVDENTRVLSGNVQITSGERVSEAEVLEYDEAAGLAILKGSPARSRLGTDLVEGNVIEYFLDSNDVVVREAVRATFEYNRQP